MTTTHEQPPQPPPFGPFMESLMLDILNQAQARYWLRRAAQFAAVGTPDCNEIAQACRNAATLARNQTP